jgi:predicted ester cyclase
MFTIGGMVVQNDDVACRLLFDCTPEAEFHGFQPNGQRISFPEHVFYRFRDGRIANVWSLIDNEAIRKQLNRAPGDAEQEDR